MKPTLKKQLLPLHNFMIGLLRGVRHREGAQNVFRRIYHNREWGRSQSVSGYGSTLEATEEIRSSLPQLFEAYGIRSLLDAPCGDLHWTGDILNALESYTGVDIVPEIIEANEARYANERVRFILGDLSEMQLPRADCILVRDLFIHLPKAMIWRCLRNILSSDITWLLISNYPDIEVYKEIEVGGCRAVNLLIPPFKLPEPALVLKESWEEKNLSLWDAKTLRASGLLSRGL